MEVDIKIKEKEIHGIKVVHIKNPGSLMSHVAFHFMSGSHGENKKNQGVSHYLEHMFFKGTEKRTYDDINNDAALLGATQNAWTSEMDTCYYLSTPAENYKPAIELLCDQIFNSTFPEEEMEKERTVIQAERKMYDDSPRDNFWTGLEESLFNFQIGHPIIGTEETIDNLTREDLIDYYFNNYGSNNVRLMIVGPMKSKEVFAACKKYLKGHPLKVIKETKIKKTLIKNYVNTNITNEKIQQTHMGLVFRSHSLADKNVNHKCMLSCLGSGLGSLLGKEIREELGLCYSISAFSLVRTPHDGVDLIHTLLDPDNAQLAREKIMEVLHRASVEGVDELTFKCAKAKMLASWCKTVGNPQGISTPLAKHKIWGLDFDLKKQYEAVKNLNHEEVNEYIKSYLTKVFFDKSSKKEFCWFSMNPEDNHEG